MKRLLRPLLATLVVGAAAGALATGCVDNDSTLFIMGALAGKPPQCEFRNEPNNLFLPSGVLDLAFSTEYKAVLLVGNQYSPRGKKDQLRTETTMVNLRGAEVVLTTDRGEPVGGAFSVVGSGFADSAIGEDPGWGLFSATLIPGSTGDGLKRALEAGGADPSAIAAADPSQTIVATVRVFGDTTGGQEIESGEFTFPIRVCYGCLIVFTVVDAATGRCVPTTEEVAIGGCFPGQDAIIDCRACAATEPICQVP